ncbi:MAG: helical backbone metal receptor, partial [Pyrinomonadaceae bacterium]
MRDTIDKSLFTVLLLAAAIAAVACGQQGAETNASTRATVDARRTVSDDLGRAVELPPKLTRVVSLAPNLTEMIFAVGGGDRLVGVTTFCNHPERAKSITKIGDTMTPNMESIVALKPDVVFVSTASQIETFTKTLADNGIAVYVTDPNTLEDVFKNLRQFGEFFGTEPVAEALVSDLKRRITN